MTRRASKSGAPTEAEHSKSVVAVDPFKCRVWSLHDRLEGEINEDSCKAEIASFLERGQLIPVLGRRLRGDPDHEIEIIYGARRLFVARHINLPLLVDIRELTDREAIVALDIENRMRKQVSPYERGVSYAHWLRVGHFTSQDEIAGTLNVSASQVSRLLQLTRLPAVLVNAFRNPSDICETWGVNLLKILDAPDSRAAILRTARVLSACSPRRPARDVYKKLLASGAVGRKPKPDGHDRVVLSDEGMPLFRICHRRNSIALVLPAEKVSLRTLQEIEAEISRVLTTIRSGASLRRAAEHDRVGASSARA